VDRSSEQPPVGPPEDHARDDRCLAHARSRLAHADRWSCEGADTHRDVAAATAARDFYLTPRQVQALAALTARWLHEGQERRLRALGSLREDRCLRDGEDPDGQRRRAPLDEASSVGDRERQPQGSPNGLRVVQLPRTIRVGLTEVR
jgi:hypothetical protein